MTGQSFGGDTNGSRPDAVGQIISLSLPLEELLKERFSAEARKAQNFALLLAALGIALAAGLVTFKDQKAGAAGFEFAIQSTMSGTCLLAAASTFFLIRFMFLAWRDSSLFRLKALAAGKAMHTISQFYVEQTQDLEWRKEELANRRKQKGPEDLDDYTSWAKALSDEDTTLFLEEKELEERMRTVDSVMTKFMSRSGFIDKYTIVFETSLPCALVAVVWVLTAGIWSGWMPPPPP